MGQKRYTPEQIIGKLRQAEVRSAEGARVAEIVRELGVRSSSSANVALTCATKSGLGVIA